MLPMLLRPLRQTVKMLLACDSPRQVAAGAAIGLALGLAPKGNLIALSLGVMLLALRVNKPAGLAVAAMATWLGASADGFFHRLGEKVLAAPGLQSFYAWLYDLPLGPWIGFNNTVVIGALLTGIYLAYPVYLFVKLLAERLQPPLAQWLMRYKIARALAGIDLTSRLGVSNFGSGS